MLAERDVIGSQLVRRNDELALLYEKIRLQQATLQTGEQQYSQRLNDIRVLAIEIRSLRCKKAILERSTDTTDAMRCVSQLRNVNNYIIYYK